MTKNYNFSLVDNGREDITDKMKQNLSRRGFDLKYSNLYNLLQKAQREGFVLAEQPGKGMLLQIEAMETPNGVVYNVIALNEKD